MLRFLRREWPFLLMVVGVVILIFVAVNSDTTKMKHDRYNHCLDVTREPAKCRELLP